MFCHAGFTEWYELLIESWGFSIKSTKNRQKKVWRLKAPKKRCNMILERNASRVAIYISWGHRDNFFCFWKSYKKSKIWKKRKSTYVQKVPETHFFWKWLISRCSFWRVNFLEVYVLKYLERPSDLPAPVYFQNLLPVYPQNLTNGLIIW